jgi:hypothetical protein
MVLATSASTTSLAPRERIAYSTRSTHGMCARSRSDLRRSSGVMAFITSHYLTRDTTRALSIAEERLYRLHKLDFLSPSLNALFPPLTMVARLHIRA